MSQSVLRAAALALVLVLPIPTAFASLEAEPRPESVTSSTERLLGEMLLASGVELPEQRAALVEGLQAAAVDIAERHGNGDPGYRKARRVHRDLHRRYLREYDERADAIQLILSEGRYNCLSASLFSALVYESLGYPTRVVEMPGHLFLEIEIKGRRIDIEATSAHGFDVARRLRAYESGIFDPSDDLRWLGVSTRARTGDNRDLWHVSLDQAIGFAWLNRAWRAWGEKQAVEAAGYVLEAARWLPDMAGRASGIDRLLGEAFLWEYEQGRFESAYRVAAVGFELDGTTTSARDRLLAAAVKRVAEPALRRGRARRAGVRAALELGRAPQRPLAAVRPARVRRADERRDRPPAASLTAAGAVLSSPAM
jgi:hypothetical protein